MKFSSNIFIGLIVASTFLIVGCAKKEDAANAVGTNTTGSNNSGGEIENVPSTDNFEVQVNTSTNYTVTISRNGDGATPCIAEENEDILCIVDMYELDMYMRGYTLNDAFPADMCEYRGFYPYFYSIAPIGPAPSHVYYQVDADNNIDVPSDGLTGLYADITTDYPGGALTADIYYYVGGRWRKHEDLYGVPAGSADDMKCPWDYSKIDDRFPNCCYAAFQYNKRSVSGTGEVSSEQASWGGNYQHCLEGPGMDWEDKILSASGIPAYVVTPVDADSGINGTFKVNAPMSITTRLGRPQVYAANYYKPADHGGDVPTMTRTVRSFWGTSPINSSAYIQYDCLGPAFEVKARIRVLAREWNEYSELVAHLAGGNGDPDSTGLETQPTQDGSDTSINPDFGELNDFPDWKDITEDELACQFAHIGTSVEGFGLTVGASPAASSMIYQYSAPGGGLEDDYLGFILDQP